VTLFRKAVNAVGQLGVTIKLAKTDLSVGKASYGKADTYKDQIAGEIVVTQFLYGLRRVLPQ
jgi:hypothetical protein